MKRSNKDQIVPIRTHRLFSLEHIEESEPPTKPKVRTRGSLIEREPPGRNTVAVQSTIGLSALLDLLRTEVKKLPLTIILHGWGTPSTRSFFDKLEILRPADALWLVGWDGESGLEAPPRRWAVILRPGSNDADARLYDNLVADMAYFPGDHESELDNLSRMAARMRTLIIEEKGILSRELLEQTPDTVRKFLWNGKSLQGEIGLGSGLEKISAAAAPSAPPKSELERIGWMLKHMTEHFEPNNTKQFEFRSYLEKMKSNFPEQVEWNEQFVRLAHQHKWPMWAVDSLPGLYVPLGSSSAEVINAYVWYGIRDYLPLGSYAEQERLCAGHFVRAALTHEGASRAQAFAERINKQFRKNQYFDDTAFSAIVETALREERRANEPRPDSEDLSTEDAP